MKRSIDKKGGGGGDAMYAAFLFRIYSRDFKSCVNASGITINIYQFMSRRTLSVLSVFSEDTI